MSFTGHLQRWREFVSRLTLWSESRDLIHLTWMSSLAINLLALAFPLALLQVYDRILPNNAMETLFMLVMIVVTAQVFEVVLRILRSVQTAWADARYEHRLSMQAFSALLDTSWDEFSQYATGNHLERMGALFTLKDFYGGQALQSLIDLPFALVYLALIYYIGGWLALVPLCTLVVFVFAAYRLGEQIQTIVTDRRAADERRVNFIIETLHSIFTIKTMAMESLMLRRYERLQRGSSKYDHELSISSALLANTVNFLMQVNTMMIVCVGSLFVINHTMTVGALAACTLLGNRALTPVSKVMTVWHRMQSIIIAEKRLNKVLSLPAECSDEQYQPSSIRGKIEFNHVSLQRSECNSMLFDDLNVTINPGETVAIVGRGVAGKSTLLQMVLGLVKPSEGLLKIDDIPLENFHMQKLRQKIAFLSQQGTLFSGTIIENIEFFRGPEYVNSALKASKLLGIDEHINQLVHGFETEISSSSIDILPNGVRQPIAIARELANNPKIVLFDEANTAVDAKADHKLLQTLRYIHGRCTLVIVSHRPSYINLADRVFALKDGKLTEMERKDAQRSA